MHVKEIAKVGMRGDSRKLRLLTEFPLRENSRGVTGYKKSVPSLTKSTLLYDEIPR